MDLWWWVLIGLAAWFVVALGIAVFIGPVLRGSSQAREVIDQQLGDVPGKPRRERPSHKRHVS